MLKQKPDTSLERNDLFAALFRQGRINCVIIMDPQGYILQVNDAFKGAFGYTDRDIIGKHTRILFTEEDRKMLRPEMELALVKKQGFSQDQNYTVHKSGQNIWVSGESVWVENKELGNCIVKVIQNIHAQKLQEIFLKEANEFSQAIFESIDDGLLVITMDLMILKANAAFYHMFDVKPATLEGTYVTNLDDLLKTNTQLPQKIQKLSEHAHLREEVECGIPGGNKRMLRITSGFLPQQSGQDKKVLLIFSDITQEKQSDQQREDLIHFVSHELRNPMANLALVVELLPDAVKNNRVYEMEEYLEKAKVNLRRLKQVIGELHDATRAATGHLAIQKANFNLQGMIREAIDTVRLLYPTHEIIAPADIEMSIHADRFRLIQVLNNYLSNAIKYSPDSNKVIVDTSLSNGTLTVSVKDYGPGIPGDQLQTALDLGFTYVKRSLQPTAEKCGR
jgi:PAS domain S-box-containing protein